MKINNDDRIAVHKWLFKETTKLGALFHYYNFVSELEHMFDWVEKHGSLINYTHVGLMYNDYPETYCKTIARVNNIIKKG